MFIDIKFFGLLLPVCMVIMAVEAVYKFRSSVFVCDSNHSQSVIFKTISVNCNVLILMEVL